MTPKTVPKRAQNRPPPIFSKHENSEKFEMF
jgi:hypothetical protein